MVHVIAASTPVILYEHNNKHIDYLPIHLNEQMDRDYVRLMDRREKPDYMSLVFYCGESGAALYKFHEYMVSEHRADGDICFPYGTEGWCIRYSYKNKKICDIYPEDGAFMIQMRMPNAAVEAVYYILSNDAKDAWDMRRPCGNGYESWIFFRVLSTEHLQDIQGLIAVKRQKCAPGKSKRDKPTKKTMLADPVVIRCVKCDSVQSIKYGLSNDKQGYKCKSCNHQDSKGTAHLLQQK